ncbi:hypothetical protein J3R82DRAFT_6547 [Butyriboletus roseoflavus]|nr:hypothetical protein J3R82DRAFT_6547 [Butyriboletus roseoflavus]
MVQRAEKPGHGNCTHRGNIVFVAELTRRYGDQGIVSTSLNPGGIETELQRHSGGAFVLFTNALLRPVSYGVITQLYAGTTADGKSLNGKYLIPWACIGTPDANTQDPEVGKKLWQYLRNKSRTSKVCRLLPN